MKILHSFIFFSLEAGSGTSEFIYQISKEQVKVGLRPTILTGKEKFDQCLANKLSGVDFHTVRSWLSRQGFSIMTGLFLWCRKNLKNYDVVHMHVFRSFQNIVLYYYCRKYNIPYIVDAHGSVPYSTRKVFIKKLFDMFIGRSLLKNASALLAETKVGIREYKNFFPDLSESKLRIIYASYDIEEFKNLPEKGVFRKLQGISPETNIVMFLGRLNPIKGLEFLIRSFAKFVIDSPNSKLYLVGGDEGSGYKELLEELVKEYKLEDLVVFPGFLSGNDKLSAVLDATVLVQCSIQEQGPRVPFDAVLIGTPVIVTQHTGSGEQVAQFDAGETVEYDNIEQLSEKLKIVTGNIEFAKNRTNNAAIRIKEELSSERICKQYQDLYFEVKNQS